MNDANVTEGPQDEMLAVTLSDGVCRIRLNQPKRFNPLSLEVIRSFQAVLDRVAQDDAIRVVVIEAAGRAFCAGHDLKQMRANPESDWQRNLFQRCGRLMQSLVALPQPVIAKVQGVATAAGCQLVASCDLAVASEDARFAVSGINLGLFCSTPAVALSRKVGRNTAMEMLLTGAFIDANEARAQGLVNRVVPAEQIDEAVDKLIAAIVAKPARVVTLGKRLFQEQLDKPLDQAYDLAADAMTRNMTYTEAQDGIDAFLYRKN